MESFDDSKNNTDNNTLASNEINNGSTFSVYFLDYCSKLNIFVTILITLIGLVGHSLTVQVYSQRRFRLNSGSVFLLSLSIVDALFLIIHFFEDTVRTINDSYSNQLNWVLNSIVIRINIVDHNDFVCRIANYFRNIFRLQSAYIIVAFTLQRLFIVYKPLSNEFKTKKSAWRTLFVILIFSLLINIWAPFLFKINYVDTHSYCDVDRDWVNEYLTINAIYMCLVMLVPILIIFVCNTLIIVKTVQDDLRRKKYKNVKSLTKCNNNNNKSTSTLLKASVKQTQRYRFGRENKNLVNSNNKKIICNQSNSKKMTKTLLLVSFSYAILNLPYLISWSLFYTQMMASIIEPTFKNNLFSALQISEMFNILNYGCHFFVYCLSGTLFRNQLKYTLSRRVKSTSSF